MIAFDPIATPFSIEMSDGVKMRVKAVVDLAHNTGVGLRLIGADRDCTMQTDTLDRLVETGLGPLRGSTFRSLPRR